LIDRNTPSDPRLRERRGDLVGRSALFFIVLVVAAFAVLTWVLLGFLPAGDATASPSTTPRWTASAGGSPSGASAMPSATIGLSPTPAASSDPAGATVGEPFDIVVDGVTVGTVTVTAPDFRRRVRGEEPTDNRRWAVVEVTYRASAELQYDAADWSVEDEDGGSHEWAGTDPDPPLRSGRLAPGEEITGFVSFQTPARKDILSVVLNLGEDGPIGFRVP
jgi:hypothetical protein